MKTTKLTVEQCIDLMESSDVNKYDDFKDKVKSNIIDLNEYGKELWFHATSKGLIDWIKPLLDCGIDVNTKANDGSTAIFWASHDIIKLLIDAGADVNAKDIDGGTAIFWASHDIIKLLIDAGADVNAKDNDGCTAIFWASHDIIKLLIDAGANVNVINNYGDYAINYYHEMNDKKTIKLFIKAGFDIDVLLSN